MLLQNTELLIKHFGYMPTFHDFEIMKVTLDRSVPGVSILIYGFTVLNEIDDQGYYKKENPCIIEIEFKKILDCELNGFNSQNSISTIVFEKENEKIKTKIETNYGLEGIIYSEEAIIKSLKKINKNKA